MSEPIVRITSTTVAEIQVGRDVDEVFASTSEGLRRRIVESVRLIAASTGEPVTATVIEGSARWPLIVHPDGTFIEATSLAAREGEEGDAAVAGPQPPADPAPTGLLSGVPAFAPAPAMAESAAAAPTPALVRELEPATEAPAPAPAFAREPASTAEPVTTAIPVAEIPGSVAAPTASVAAEPVTTAISVADITRPLAAPTASVAAPSPGTAGMPTPAATPLPVAAEPASTALPAVEASAPAAEPASTASAPAAEPASTASAPATASTPAPAAAPTASSAAPTPATAGPLRSDGVRRDPTQRVTPTVEDLLSSRGAHAKPRATEGWQGAVRRMTGGAISPQPGKAERSRLDRERAVQRRLDAPRTIVVLNPKGGAHKTTSTLLLAATFGTQRGGATLAWDNNETRGTLGWRAQHAPHHRTAVDLLEDLDRFAGSTDATLSALDTYVRTQVDARFDVLASDEDAAASSTIDAAAFERLHGVLSRYYRLLIVDTGNNMRASNWVAAVAAADQLVIVSTVREDTAASAAWLLDGLREKGFDRKIDEAVTILAAPSARPDRKLAERLERHFAQVTSAVVHVPFDPALVDGGPIDFEALSPESRDAWLTVAATVAEGL
ncbi:chromosome partitioning protein [Microbacterium invictum]|uniref:MinD-like ATPase involved in chromosome partitioning or flagellar assembly n=1 Tax=Microbacterium invictum TaxID=515415 RepID=A0AA40SQG3_9MICO|nr:chromosome partitioning protein [Microbacterium invictum]MBB4140518.1 MinD-like ATPase involved in chromosome partitioning or flagellar assembly [Microbacterium invictum]